MDPAINHSSMYYVCIIITHTKPVMGPERNFRSSSGTSSEISGTGTELVPKLKIRNGTGTAVFGPFLVPFWNELVPILQAFLGAVNPKNSRNCKETLTF